MDSFRALALLLLVAGCRLPVEQTYPVMAPYMVAGAVLDVSLQVAKRPLWQRAAASVTVAGIVRYSTCCRRPEGAHIGIMFGVSLAEWARLARSVLSN
jgi:hypothetical protein